MKFDGGLFIKQLKQYEVSKEDNKKYRTNKGFSKALEHVWFHTPTSNVNFDEFTVEDVEDVLGEMELMPYIFDEGGETFVCDPGNRFVIFDQLFDVFYKLNNYPNKQYYQDEDDLFI